MRKITGTIAEIRKLEDDIRATKRYTECLSMGKKNHPEQGCSEPSVAYSKKLEIYLDADFQELDWDMDAVAYIISRWNWFKSRATIVTFWYDYRNNTAKLEVKDQATLDRLYQIIPGFDGKAVEPGQPVITHPVLSKA